jgi:hypothetical protein
MDDVQIELAALFRDRLVEHRREPQSGLGEPGTYDWQIRA